MFHCGSRGFGHQIATDYLQAFLKVMQSKYGIPIRDRELACAPFRSPEGQDYFKAMNCAINMSFANRQVILHRIREVFSEIFGQDPDGPGPAPGLRRDPQHRQGGSATASRGNGAAAGAPQGGHPGVRPGNGGHPRRSTGRSASR